MGWTLPSREVLWVSPTENLVILVEAKSLKRIYWAGSVANEVTPDDVIENNPALHAVVEDDLHPLDNLPSGVMDFQAVMRERFLDCTVKVLILRLGHAFQR